MPHPRTKSRTIVIALAATAIFGGSASAHAEARKGIKAPPPPNADQQLVVAAIINDTFRLSKQQPLTLALCLDVQIGPALDEDAAPAPPPRRRGARKPLRAPEPAPMRLRGAPPELVTALARPWRVVASSLACRLDPRQPFTLGDASRTPAQLVTVHLTPDVAVGTIKVDWTDPRDPTVNNSRDCTALRGAHGPEVHCGGTWFQ